MKLSKRQRRWVIATASVLAAWIAYDIWDHSRHPVFWGVSYIFRMPWQRDYYAEAADDVAHGRISYEEMHRRWDENYKMKCAQNSARVLAKLRGKGLQIESVVRTQKYWSAKNLSSGGSITTSSSALLDSNLYTNYLVSSITSKHALLDQISAGEDIERINDDLLLVAEVKPLGEWYFDVYVDLITLGGQPLSRKNMIFRVFTSIDAEVRVRLASDKIAIVSVVSSKRYVLLAIDPSQIQNWYGGNSRRPKSLIDSREYRLDGLPSGY